MIEFCEETKNDIKCEIDHLLLKSKQKIIKPITKKKSIKKDKKPK